MGHVLMENRHGLAVDVETTRASGTAEREAAKTMVARTVTQPATLGADKGYDVAEFVQAMREAKVTPHVAQKAKSSATDGRTNNWKRLHSTLGYRSPTQFLQDWMSAQQREKQ